MLGAVALDLVLPVACGGCGAPGSRWCPACRAALKVGRNHPEVITPRLDPGVPVFAMGRYAGPRREAIVALKEHGRRDLVVPLARVMALGLHQLLSWGVLTSPLNIVPAPTRPSAARRRGGDPVARIAAAAAAAGPQFTVVPALRTTGLARDSVGLSTSEREGNIAGRVRLTRTGRRDWSGDVLLVDDIVTTGATARESVRTLHSAGADVVAVLTLAHA